MPRKRIRAEILKLSPDAKSLPKTVKDKIKEIQGDLQKGEFEDVLEEAFDLLGDLKVLPNADSFYFTARLWEIRARQGLRQDRETVIACIRKYREDAEAKGMWSHVIQAFRMEAQDAIDRAAWGEAIANLEAAADIAVAQNDRKTAIELLMHVCALETKSCHYESATRHMDTARDMLDQVANTDEIVHIKRQIQAQLADLALMTGRGLDALKHIDVLVEDPPSDFEDACVQVMLMNRVSMLNGRVSDTLAQLMGLSAMVRQADPAKLAQVASVHADQLNLIAIDLAQAEWAHGDQDRAYQRILDIQKNGCSEAVRHAIVLLLFQWSVEAGMPFEDPQQRCDDFDALELPTEGNVPMLMAAALAQAEMYIQMGLYDETIESLGYIEETGLFTKLYPIATKAHMMRAVIELVRGNYDKAYEVASECYGRFMEQIDAVASFEAIVTALAAKYEIAKKNAGGEVIELDDEMMGTFDEIQNQVQAFMENGNAQGVRCVGIPLARIALSAGMTDRLRQILDLIRPCIRPEYMAYQAMEFEALCYASDKDPAHREMAEKIAKENEFVLNLP